MGGIVFEWGGGSGGNCLGPLRKKEWGAGKRMLMIKRKDPRRDTEQGWGRAP